MPLFTVTVDRMDDSLVLQTSIAQVTAESTIHALESWARIAPSLGIPSIGPAFTARALNDDVFLDPTPLPALQNVWRTSTTYRGHLLMLNVMATNQGPVEKGVSAIEKLLEDPEMRVQLPELEEEVEQ